MKPVIVTKCLNPKCTVDISNYFAGEEDIIPRDKEGKAICPMCEGLAMELGGKAKSKEVWVNISGSIYDISSRGKIRKFKNNRYQQVEPTIRGGSKTIYVGTKTYVVNTLMQQYFGVKRI